MSINSLRQPKLPSYDPSRSYEWNYQQRLPQPDVDVPPYPGDWDFLGIPVPSPLGVPAGPLLNGNWCLYYSALGFDVVTYKTVRSQARECYDLPNLQPVDCPTLQGHEACLDANSDFSGSWAVSFGMPSREPKDWQQDVRRTRQQLPSDKVLVVSVVASQQPDWTMRDMAEDYAACAQLARDSGADVVETNFSCPNVSTCDGQLYQHAEQAALVAATVRDAIDDTPYIAKIGHIAEPAEAELLVRSLAPFVDALAMTNSIATQVRDQQGNLLFAGQRRGICGKATLAASVAQTRVVQQVISEQRLPLKLIGVGGASCYEDVKAYQQAGAHAVHVATAAMADPLVAIDIRRDAAMAAN